MSEIIDGAILEYFSEEMRREILEEIINRRYEIEYCTEIKIRVDRPILITTNSGELIICPQSGYPTGDDVRRLFESFHKHSLYAFENSIKQGFVTIENGHRIGFCGQAVLDGDRVVGLENISSINIRIRHELPGISRKIMSLITEADRVCNTLIISGPGKGKTTLLRDIVRNVSEGYYSNGSFIKGSTVAVIDERNELGASFKSVINNDMGMRTDIVSGMDKARGINLMLRSMNPSVIAVDEIGTMDDAAAIKRACNCGCSVIATMHGRGMVENNKVANFDELISESIFQKYILIDKVGDYRVVS